MGRKLKPGDSELPAIEWNRHVDASDRVLGGMDERGGISRGFLDTNVVTVKNSSGADRRRGDILEFTGWPLDDPSIPDKMQPWITGGSPTLANGICVLAKPIKSGEYDDAFVAGACFAYVNVLDADDRYARPIAATYVLQSVAIGPVRILYKPTGTGEKTCFIHLLGVSGEILVKNQSGGNYAANGGPHDYHVYIGTPGSYTDTGQVLSAYNIPAFNNNKMGAASLLEGVAYAAPWET